MCSSGVTGGTPCPLDLYDSYDVCPFIAVGLACTAAGKTRINSTLDCLLFLRFDQVCLTVLISFVGWLEHVIVPRPSSSQQEQAMRHYHCLHSCILVASKADYAHCRVHASSSKLPVSDHLLSILQVTLSALPCVAILEHITLFVMRCTDNQMM